MSLLVRKAKEDAKFFYDLVWNTEKILPSLDFLSRDEKAAIMAIRPEDLVIGLATNFRDGGLTVAECGGTCGASCGGSCGASCGGSCTVTCAASCPATGLKPDGADEVINPAEIQRLALDIHKTIGQNFSRFRR